MTTKKMIKWIEFCGYNYNFKHGDQQLIQWIDIPPITKAGNAIRYIYHDGMNVYLDSQLYGVPPIKVENRYHLKEILGKPVLEQKKDIEGTPLYDTEKIQARIAELEKMSPEEKTYWKEEERKCIASPYYYATTYMKNQDGTPFTTRYTEKVFNNFCKN